MVSDVDFAWAAGFFDGEGCTSVLTAKRDRHSYLRMSVSQKDREVLDKFHSIVGCGKVYTAKTRPIHSWDCYTETECESVLELLWPYLGSKKKQQANEARNTVYRRRNTVESN